MTESPNKFISWGNNKILGVTIHFTAAETAKSSINWFMNPASKASAHVVIDHDGTIHNVVSVLNRAYHAGISSWGGLSGCNNFMLGIELVNVGKITSVVENGKEKFITAYGDKLDGEKAYDLVSKQYWEIYYEPQIKACLDLLKEWKTKYGFSQSYIVGHSHIAPGRKTDPGPIFPWERIGLAFPESDKDKSFDNKALQSHLERLGFELGTIDGVLGKKTFSALDQAIAEYKLLEKIQGAVIFKENEVAEIRDSRRISNLLRKIPWNGYIS